MHCNCTMMSPGVTLPMEEEGVDVDGTDRDGVKREGGATDSSRDLNCTSLCFTVVASMAHMKVKWSNTGKGLEKWNKILVITEGKMSLLQDAESR